MSIPVWPAALDRFERPGWQVQPQDGRQRRGNEAGPPGYRRRFSSVAKGVSLSIVLTRDEKAIFDNFYEDDCAQGSREFWMPDPTTHGWPLLTEDGTPILVEEGVPLHLSERWLCSWGDPPPTEVIVGQVQFRKSFSVWVLP